MPLRAKINFPRVVIVTGGADGFGSAITDKFHQKGSKVIIIDLNRSKAESKATVDGVECVVGDVTKRETWEEAVALAMGMYGRVDVVVNNAGITFAPSPVHTKDMAEFDKTFNVNVKPIFLSAQVIAPIMQRQESGIFINITSTGSTRPRPDFAFYNASKAAVAIATKTMALEYAPSIRFNCIAPAIGNTAMLQASIGDGEDSAERQRRIEESLPMRRVAEPGDIANAAWFLGSEKSGFVTGIVLEVDGGRGI
ncbi:hypothetical protein MW887_002649 [Aspergillus wentii]|nr:hypothetical protein MW887_002649 [Aspergillus wentii]